MSDSPTDTTPPAQVWPSVRARDAGALITFLVDVVGFREAVVYRDGDTINHAELAWPPGGGVMLGSSRESDTGHPSLAPGSASAYMVSDDPDAIHARVVAAGAMVLLAPYDTDYGSREFAFEDPEGNRWSVGTYRGHPGATAA